MKRPLTPEKFSSLLVKHQESIGEILQSWNSPTIKRRYLHWDKVRQRTPPGKLTQEQWWLGIKLARSGQLQVLPGLKALDGRSFVFMLPSLVLEGLHRIDSRMHGLVGVPESAGLPAEPDRFIINTLIREAITSSQLEGASTTRAEAVDMLRSGRRPRDRSEQMILNNFHAMQAVRELRNVPLSIEEVLRLHRTITMGTLDNPRDAGRFQEPEDKRVYVAGLQRNEVLHQPPPASELPKRMERMIRFANQEDESKRFIHPVIRAIALHFWLSYDHPFADGNGRTARALFYWSMLRSGYRLFQFISISRYLREAPTQYARSFLFTETDDNDLTYFISLQVELILGAIDDLQEYIARKTEQIAVVERMLKQSTGLNHRQLALLAHAIRTPAARYTVRSHSTSQNVARATARSDLLSLAERGLLERKPADKKTYIFHVPPDFEARIRSLNDQDV